MSRKQPESGREYTQGEQNEGFIGRRMKAFADRSREPGDGATWSVVLGALMWTLLIVCYSVAGQSLIAFFVFVLTLVWIVIMARFGNVNVPSILWGSATTDSEKPPVEIVVYQSTLVVAIISLIAVVANAGTGWSFGWYGFVLVTTIAVFVVIYIRSWLQPVR